MDSPDLQVLESPASLPIYVRGPKLTEGKLPAFFYFALSGEDSLCLDPFNQPVVFLKETQIRCFSFDLPFHGTGFDRSKAMDKWIEELKAGSDFLDTFFRKSLQNIDYLVQQGFVDEEKIAVGGLSRGGAIAAHLAARDSRLKYILGFAPVTKIESQGWNLHDLIDKLVDKEVRFYIGNRDLRVGTRDCFDFIDQLAQAAYEHGYRSPPIELIITPSVGFKGHGTLPLIFKDGANWILQKLFKK